MAETANEVCLPKGPAKIPIRTLGVTVVSVPLGPGSDNGGLTTGRNDIRDLGRLLVPPGVVDGKEGYVD